MPITCTRIIGFDMGHRVYQHEGKCSHPHGHRYTAEITAIAPNLDSQGRVIDFSVLKSLVGGWIEANWDHAFMLSHLDPAIPTMQQFPMTQGDLRLVIVPFNPTAENIAAHLGRVVCPEVLKDTEVQVVRIRLYETPNCYVDWSIGGPFPSR